MGGVAAAFVAEVQHGHRILVAASLAILFLDLPFDRQAVRVPAGDVTHALPGHAVRPHDDVLQDTVQRVADVQVAVGVDRPVMQHPWRAGGHLRLRPVPQADALPARQQLWLAHRQVAAHGELGLG